MKHVGKSEHKLLTSERGIHLGRVLGSSEKEALKLA